MLIRIILSLSVATSSVAAPLSAVHVHNAGGVSGATVVNGEYLQFQPLESSIHIPQNQNPKNIELKLNFGDDRNLPAGVQRAVTFKQTFRLSEKKQKAADGSKTKVLTGVRAGKVSFEKQGTVSKEIESLLRRADCSNKTAVTVLSDNVLQVEVGEIDSLADCLGGHSDLWKYSVNYMGQRRLTELNGANGRKDNFFNPAEDEGLGYDFAHQFVAENDRYILDENHPTSLYVRNVMDRIARASDNSAMRPKVWVINADVLNAFALPGGYVFVFRGLIEKSENEAQLAGVLGHEWAHAVARHGTKGMTRAIKAVIASLVIRIALLALRDNADDTSEKIGLIIADLAAQLVPQLVVLGKGRDAELEADTLGAQYAWNAGYAPFGVGQMFQVFKRLSGGSSYNILSSHPDHDHRIEHNFALSALMLPVKQYDPLQSDAYVYAKNEISRLPYAGSGRDIGLAFQNSVNNYAQKVVSSYTGQHYDD